MTIRSFARWTFFFLLFLFFIVACFVGYIYRHREEFTSNFLTKLLQVNCSVESIDFSPQGIKIKDIEIANPSNCSFPYAFEADEIDIKLNWSSFFKGLTGLSSHGMIISEIAIPNPEVTLEIFSLNGSDNNWSRILQAVAKDTAEEKPSRTVIVERLLITNIDVRVKNHVMPLLSAHPSPIAIIEVKNLGDGAEFSTGSIVYTIFGILLKEVSWNIGVNGILPATAPVPALILQTLWKLAPGKNTQNNSQSSTTD